MICYLDFEGPGNTLFLVDSGTLRAITHAGQEVVLPIQDLIELLVFLSLQPTQALRRLHNDRVSLLTLALLENC